MKFDFVPNIAQGESATYSGKLVIEIPKVHQRHQYLMESGVVAIMKSGNEDKGKFNSADSYSMAVKLMGHVEKHILEVALVRLSDGKEVKTKDEFLSFQSCEPALIELCTMFMEGFEPGKNSEA